MKIPMYLAFLALAQCTSPSHGQDMVFQTSEIGKPLIDSLRVRAHSRNGVSFTYNLSRGKTGSTIVEVVQGAKKNRFEAPTNLYPNIDISSAQFFYDEKKASAHVVVNFGPPHSCSDIQEDRSSLRIVLSGAKPVTYVSKPPGC